MSKQEGNPFQTNWYEVWMKQSKDFFDVTEKNFKDLFAKHTPVNPEDHMKLIHQWTENLKKQWDLSNLTDQQKMYEGYWKSVYKMYTDAADMLVQQWTQRTKENNPIKNTHDLYALWLNCCNEIYKKAMHSHSYQEAYGDMMNATINFWKSALPK